MDPFELVGGLISGAGSVFGGQISADAQKQIAAQNIANQKEFAQSGVQWRVRDAAKAGISPLAAMGFSGPSFSNVTGSTALGEGIASAGQNIGRAFKSGVPAEDRQLSLAGAKLDLEGKNLDNDLKRQELAKKVADTNAAGNPPGFVVGPDNVLMPGQGDSFKVGAKPLDMYGNKMSSMIVGNRAFDPSHKFSDSQIVQNRWGDTIQDVIAPFAADEDMSKNMGQRIPQFLWEWANQGSAESSEWIKKNGYAVLQALRRSARIDAPWK